MINGKISIGTADCFIKLFCHTVRLFFRLVYLPWVVAYKRPGSNQYSYLIYAEPFKKLTGYREDGEQS